MIRKAAVECDLSNNAYMCHHVKQLIHCDILLRNKDVWMHDLYKMHDCMCLSVSVCVCV